MDFIQIYSMIYLSLTFLILFIDAGVALEKEKTVKGIVVAVGSLVFWTPIIGRIFNWW